MITSVFRQFPAFPTNTHARCWARATQTPEPSMAKHPWAIGLALTQGWHCPPAPCVPQRGLWGAGSLHAQHRANPGLCHDTLGLLLSGLRYQTHPSHRRGWREKLSMSFMKLSNLKRKVSQPERILAWIWKSWGCPHHCTIRDVPWFFPCYTGKNIVRDPSTKNPLLDLQAPHMSEITGKIKTWETTTKEELPGKRSRMICCFYEASVELQQVRKERLSGMSELHTFSYYTPDFCLWTHCYSIREIFAPAVLFSLFTKWHKTSFITFARKLLPFLRIIYILK